MNDPLDASAEPSNVGGDTSEASKKVSRVVLQTTVTATALGVVLSPIPLADELLLVPIYGVMTARIGRARGVKLSAVPWRPISKAIAAGLAARAAANIGFSWIPGVAAVANAISAAALTKILGSYIDTACKNGVVPESPFKRAEATPAHGAA